VVELGRNRGRERDASVFGWERSGMERRRREQTHVDWKKSDLVCEEENELKADDFGDESVRGGSWKIGTKEGSSDSSCPRLFPTWLEEGLPNWMMA